MDMQAISGFYDLVINGFLLLGGSAVAFILVDAINFGQINPVNQED